MTREEAKRKAWDDWRGDAIEEDIPGLAELWGVAFDAGWEARKAPNLQPVIDWLERGCDPAEAAKELRIHQSQAQA